MEEQVQGDAAHQLLAIVVQQIEAEAREGLNTFLIRAAIEACVVLGFNDLGARATAVFASIPDEAFFAGAIKNFEPTAGALSRLRQMHKLDALNQRLPPFRKDLVEEVAVLQEPTRLAWHGMYEDAFAAGRVLRREPHETSAIAEIAVTAAILGDFRIAEDVIKDEILSPGDTHLIKLVLAIEYARAQMFSEAARVTESLLPLQGFDCIYLALGRSGRRPWEIYPYPDY